MSSGSTLLLAALAVTIMCVAVAAASKRPGDTWNYYHFDGSGFIAGQPSVNGPFLAVRDHVLPVVLPRMAKVEAVALPPGFGVLAGICYIQISGGRLAGNPGYAPCPGVKLEISSGGRAVSHAVSDENGYFVAVLAAGSYRIGIGAFTAEVTLETGRTTLAALPAGKRMVD